MDQTYDWLAERIQTSPSPRPVRLVAVDGYAGSGKSTFARNLAVALGAPILQIDDFLAWDDLTDFWLRLEREVLEPALAGKPFRYQVRDWEHDVLGRNLGPWKESPAADYFILEGVGASRREVADRLACAIWVEAPQDLRMARGIARDGEAMRGHWEKWQVMEEAFMTKDGTRARAHLVVDGTTGTDHAFGFLNSRGPFNVGI